MVLLRTETGWEKTIIPAFVYFFAQLYPFRWVNRPGRPDGRGGGRLHARPPPRARHGRRAWLPSAARSSTTSPSAGC